MVAPPKISQLLANRVQLARWVLDVLRAAPAMHHGAGRWMDASDKESLVNVAAGEFLQCDETGAPNVLRRLIEGKEDQEVEIDIRHALWRRMSELISQECENRNPEFKHARRRLKTFIEEELCLFGLVHFSLFRIRYVTTEHGAGVRNRAIIPRDVLQSTYAVPADALKYGNGLGEYIVFIMNSLERSEIYRPWLSVDDLAAVLADAEKVMHLQPWMVEDTCNPTDSDIGVTNAFLQSAAARVTDWFDHQYAPGKQYIPEVKNAIREAFLDHVTQLITDPENHPGLQAIIVHHLSISAEDYRNSSYRKDFEYVVKRFRDEVRSQIISQDTG